MDQTDLLVHDLGLSRTLRGFRCLVVALKLVREDIALLTAVTTRLYPMVADHLDTSPSRVERNLRTAVEICWQYGNRELLAQIIRCPHGGRPSVSELIDQLAVYLQTHETM